MKTEKEKMLSGIPYLSTDTELTEERRKAREKQLAINHAESPETRTLLIKAAFGSTGENLHIEPDVAFDYGYNIHLGENFYANFNCTFLDVMPIKIGRDCLLAPNVQLYTAAHSILPEVRKTGLEYGKPITIGDNVWIGGGAIILPGVTLGRNVVVGAGAVVTKSFPDNVVIAGNPAKIIRTIKNGGVK